MTHDDEYLKIKRNKDKDSDIITVECIDNCIRQLKLNKAAGLDGIEAEHILNAHPVLVCILKVLFNGILQHGYVSILNMVWLYHSWRMLYLRTLWRYTNAVIIICPIAIAYSMGQIIKSVCVCVCVCLSVRLRALSRSHFFIDFHQNWHRRQNPEK